MKFKSEKNRKINEISSSNKRRSLKNQLIKESKAVSKDSMTILAEFEKIIDINNTSI